MFTDYVTSMINKYKSLYDILKLTWYSVSYIYDLFRSMSSNLFHVLQHIVKRCPISDRLRPVSKDNFSLHPFCVKTSKASGLQCHIFSSWKSRLITDQADQADHPRTPRAQTFCQDFPDRTVRPATLPMRNFCLSW